MNLKYCTSFADEQPDLACRIGRTLFSVNATALQELRRAKLQPPNFYLVDLPYSAKI
jgi:hypothetical protein